MEEKKCKKCGKPITFEVFGMPPDICWGCASNNVKKEAILLNANLIKPKTET